MIMYYIFKNKHHCTYQLHDFLSRSDEILEQVKIVFIDMPIDIEKAHIWRFLST